ncbi:hypothetical protein MASR2M117_01660 [Paludibacter sp.]
MKEQQYIHIFAGESNYSHALLTLLDKHILLEEHIFCFGFGKMDKQKSDLQRKLESKFLYIRNPLHVLKFLFLLSKCKWIYFHYLSYDPTLFFWFFNKKLLKKSTWIVWGNDVYSYHRRNNSLRTRTYEYLRRRIIPIFPEIAAFVKEDVEFIKTIYSSKAEYIPILYPIPVQLDHLMNVDVKKESNVPVFLLGNSNDPSNQHLEILELMAKHKSQEFKIYCPLSYGGTKAYRELVIATGKFYFGDKFIPLVSMLDATSYAKLLSEVDIALMNHNRQQALGNILALMFLGKKIFMKTNISSYYFFLRNHFDVFDIDNIQSLDFNSVVEAVPNTNNNKHQVMKIIDEKNYLLLWRELLNRH